IALIVMTVIPGSSMTSNGADCRRRRCWPSDVPKVNRASRRVTRKDGSWDTNGFLAQQAVAPSGDSVTSVHGGHNHESDQYKRFFSPRSARLVAAEQF